MNKKLRKRLILGIPYLLFAYLFGKAAQAVRLSPGADASRKLLHLKDGFVAALGNPLPSFNPTDMLIGIAGAVVVAIAVYTKGKRQEVSQEHGIRFRPLGHAGGHCAVHRSEVS